MSRLFSWLLNLAYLAALVACAPLVLWAMVRTGKYRDGYREKLLGLVPRCPPQGLDREKDLRVWIHAVSVGEVNLLATTIGQLRARHPHLQVVLSTTTRAGYDLARRKYPELTVFYAPLDFSWAVSEAIGRVRPSMLVLAELEIWPNLIAAAKRSGAAVAVINGRMSDRSFRGYRRLGPFIARVMQQIDLVAAQDEQSAQRFRALGAAEVQVTGSLKYDGAETNRQNPRTGELRALAALREDDVVLLAGSTQAPEEQSVLEIFQRLAPEYPRLRLIVVPRHPERFDEVADLLDRSGCAWVRRSRLEGRDAASRSPPSAILLVDTVGELGAWWGTATIGFVGGSFGSRGGQNMIEPAALGVATSFGPNTWNFRDIVAALVGADAAVEVQSAGELEEFIRRCLDDRQYAERLGENAQALVASQLGATERTLKLLEGPLNRQRPLAA